MTSAARGRDETERGRFAQTAAAGSGQEPNPVRRASARQRIARKRRGRPPGVCSADGVPAELSDSRENDDDDDGGERSARDET